MRRIEVKKGGLIIKEKMEVVYEERVIPSGNSAKTNALMR